MVFVRGTLAVIVGCVIAAATWKGVVASVFGGDATAPDRQALILSFGALVIGAAVGGFFCTLVAGAANSPAIYVTIGVLAAMLGRAFYLQTSSAPDWYHLVGLLALAFGYMVGASAGAYRLDRR